MRSSGFVFFSLLIHAGLLAALVLAPVHTVTTEKPDKIEVDLGEAPPAAGVPEAAAAPQPPPPVEAAPVEAAAPAAPTPKPVVAAKPLKAVKTAHAKKAAAAPAPEVLSTPAAPEEKADVAAAPEEPKEDEATEEPADLKPVVEKPSGVTADTTPTEPAEEKPAPVAEAPAVSEAVPVAAAGVAAAAAAAKGAADGNAVKGGASKEGAVSYLDLRQLPGNKPPQYPLKARLENRQGSAELVYRVTKEGKVADVQVAKSTGFADLDKEAVRAISQFKYVPGQEGWARHPVNFALKGQVVSLPSQLRGKGAQAD